MGNQQDRDRFQKEIEVEVQKIDASFQKISVSIPQGSRGEFDQLRQAVKGLVERYRNQPTQLPSDPNAPSAGHELPDPDNPQAGTLPSGGGGGGRPSGGTLPSGGSGGRPDQSLPPGASPKK